MNGKRVNFNIRKINNPDYPKFAGFRIILWVFNLYYAWKTPDELAQDPTKTPENAL